MTAKSFRSLAKSEFLCLVAENAFPEPPDPHTLRREWRPAPMVADPKIRCMILAEPFFLPRRFSYDRFLNSSDNC